MMILTMIEKISTTTIRIGFVLILISLVSLEARAQQAQEESACTQNLDAARTLFDDGRIHEIPVRLQSCLVSGFTDAEQTEALRLLVLTHIYLEEPTLANQRMLELLKHEHEFQPNPAVDPTEFVLLYQTFRTKPIMNISLKVGTNIMFIQTTQVNGTNNLDLTSDRGTNRLKFNFNAALGAEIPLNPKFMLAPEFQFSIQTQEFQSDVLIVDDGSSRIQPGADGLLVSRNFTWLKLPVMVQYFYKPGKLNPYLSLGPSFDLLLGAKIPGDGNTLDIDGLQQAELSTTDIKAEYRTFNFAIAAGAGIKLKVGEGFITADLRYNYGLLKNVKSGHYYNTSTIFDLKLANNQFKAHVLQLTVGYIINVYSPKKLSQ
jgi:hypothetical protein